jgi:hypothetical protein
LAEVFGRDLSQLDLLAIFIDGMLIAEHCVVVADIEAFVKMPTNAHRVTGRFG